MKEEIKYTRYVCDCCKKESQKDGFLTKVILPAKRCIPSDWQGLWNFARSTASFEVCDNCLEEMYDLLTQKFEILDVDYGGKSIRRKEHE